MNEPLLVIVLKIFDKCFDNLSGNAFTKSTGMSRKHIEVFFSLRIFTSTSTGCTTGISWFCAWGWGILNERLGRVCTIAARCLFNDLAVVSRGTSRLKSIFFAVLPLIFLTVLYHCFGRALKSSSTLLR